MKRHLNLLLLIAVVLITALPLWLVERPPTGPDGKAPEIFAGADNQARDLVSRIAPDYKPWFEPLLEPASGEIASLLFALQAALGAGFIGYYLGVARTRRKLQQEAEREQARPAAAQPDQGQDKAC